MLKEEMKNIKSTPRELRNFGFLVGGIFLVLGAWFGYSGRHSWELVTALGALLVFFGAVFPRVLAPVYKAWMALGAVLGPALQAEKKRKNLLALPQDKTLYARTVGTAVLRKYRPHTVHNSGQYHRGKVCYYACISVPNTAMNKRGQGAVTYLLIASFALSPM